ncbi:hypothetical protein H310_10565 [Aphanomyces invadans]|uniref:Peroxisomal ATPase PEX6 n=1 Tax=Aphanomyces invadans TaxID=157072 RepID=A0A024TR18_9STRA|nr:hypothetical protein H310_10565 [Aphanomyces invadans]ETV96419.1 hypothetical protein H310_10565 [Aphanomyces invadans]|eukprot:XP_008875211.1 hypothetical protein H310_10565 [Aphanomyces invadans]
MWCSSFTQRARGWEGIDSELSGSNSLTLRMCLLDQLDLFPTVGIIPSESNAVVAMSMANLRRLGLVSHALVSIRNGNASRVAQAQLHVHAADDVVHMSPFLAHNLRCVEMADVVVAPAFHASYGRMQALPPTAARVQIAPILWNASSSPHELHVLAALRTYFAIPRMLQVGDIFGVPLIETFPERQTHAAEGNASPVFDPIVVHADVIYFLVQHASMPNGEICDTAQALSVVRDKTTLVQTSPVSTRLMHERQLRQYVLSTTTNLPSPATSVSIFPQHMQKLIEWLHPTSLSLPISIVLGGVAGSGKKMLLYNAAEALGMFVLEIAFADLVSTSEVQMLENIRAAVAKAQSMAPCILFLNRFFQIQNDNQEAELRLGSTLADCMTHGMHHIPLVIAVEDISDLPALIRQNFMYELVLEAPSEPERVDILKQLTASVELHPDVHLENIAHRTAGRTLGELKALIADATTYCLEGLGGEDSISSMASPQVRLEHFDHAIHHQQTKTSLGLGTFSIPNVKWDDVGGLEHVKDEILDMVQLPFKHPEFFAAGVRQRSGILLYGPPGTGKTLLAKAIATECNMNFISVKGPELLNMYIGESEKNVRHARNARPCILFFDELDSLAPMRGRGSDSGGVMDRVVSQLLTEIDSNLNEVFVVGATNRPDLIETALLRPGRFDRLLYLGICNDKPTQLKVVKALTRKFHLADSVDLNAVVALCPLHFTGADFYALCSMALSLAIKDRVAELESYIAAANQDDVYSARPLHTAMVLEKMSPDELQVQVTHDHFAAALPHIVPSVSASELAHYEKLRQQFSSLAK